MIFDRGGESLQRTCRIINLLFAVAHCTVERRSRVILQGISLQLRELWYDNVSKRDLNANNF